MNGLKNWWMDKWSGFEKNHPKLAKWVYQIFYFFVFSMGGYDLSVSRVHFHAAPVGKRSCRNGVYVAPGAHESLRR